MEDTTEAVEGSAVPEESEAASGSTDTQPTATSESNSDLPEERPSSAIVNENVETNLRAAQRLPPIVKQRSTSAGPSTSERDVKMDLEGFRNRGKSLSKEDEETENKSEMITDYDDANLPGTILDDTPIISSAAYISSKYDDLYSIAGAQKKSIWEKPEVQETVYFRDGRRTIDFVLAYEDDGDPIKKRRRRTFQKNMLRKGLELEVEDRKDSETGETYFIKVHAPWDLLSRYAEILKLKKPVKKENPLLKKRDIFSRLGIKNPFMYNEDLIAPEPHVFTAGFTFHKQDMFLIKDRELFFTQAQRNLVVWEILKRIKFSNTDVGFGIHRLLASNVYLAAYPLHDGPYNRDIEGATAPCERRLLYLEWVKSSNWYKLQPLHLIRRYFGDKMALYFAWLGFYTQMLIPAAIFGIFTFICGLFFMNSSYNKPSEEICNDNDAGNVTMCPQCDVSCFFWTLNESCLNSKIAFLFDNPMTVFFAIGMSIWATMFLELWKRKQAVIQWQWDMEHYEDDEEMRAEFEEKVTTMRVNPVTNKKEPYLPSWNKISRCVAANSVVFLMLLLVLAAMLGVIIYRMAVAAVMYKTNQDLITKNTKLVTSITAATLNLIVILILNLIYEKIVLVLTNKEMPRTQTEYEDSFTLKMFLFQSINYYSSLVYIAFFKLFSDVTIPDDLECLLLHCPALAQHFQLYNITHQEDLLTSPVGAAEFLISVGSSYEKGRGRFFYHPGDPDARRNILLQLRYDMCDPAGCLFELCVQLAIIMVGKQLASSCVEMFIPFLKVWWNKRQNKDDAKLIYTRWEKDYDLAEYTRLSLFYEYLEMVVQYGFITLFVAAFPLAPFFALVNNVVEIRLDAYKYLTTIRRPLPHRVQDIGIWFGILKAITYISVLTNAVVISYTSDFIPRLVYMYAYSNDFNLEGYITNSLSQYNVSEYEEGMGPDRDRFPKEVWPTTCFYRAYRNPPDHELKYEVNTQFWHVFTARLSFIILFEHFIFLATGLLSWWIPDMPVEVKSQIVMERKVEKETLFESEMRKIKEERKLLRRKAELGLDGMDVDLGDGCQTPTSITSSRSVSRTPSPARRSSKVGLSLQDADS